MKEKFKKVPKKRGRKPGSGTTKKIDKKSNKKDIIQNTNLTFKYKGNGRWVIFQLKEDCDISENYEAIEQELNNSFGDDIEHFIPVYREKIDKSSVGLTLFDGYIFLRYKSGQECVYNPGEYRFLEGPLMRGGKINYASDREINILRANLYKKLQKRFPRRGQMITPKSGTFKNLEGKVVGIDRKNRVVRAVFKQSSREVGADINVINLDFEEK
jgi:transcription antitermination factor NusG